MAGQTHSNSKPQTMSPAHRYTEGPWSYDKVQCRIVADNVRPFWADPDEDYRVSVVDLHGAMGGDDSTADALLMAAAPEMLDCLAMVLEADEDVRHIPPMVRAKIERVAAKAKGEAA